MASRNPRPKSCGRISSRDAHMRTILFRNELGNEQMAFLLLSKSSDRSAPAQTPPRRRDSGVQSSAGVLTNLRMGHPGDAFEREADRTADQVIERGAIAGVQQLSSLPHAQGD